MTERPLSRRLCTFFLLILLLALGSQRDASVAVSAAGQDAQLVPIETAQLAASENVSTFFSGRWSLYSSVVLFDVSGSPAAYAVVFANANQEPPAPEQLQASIKVKSLEIRSIQQDIERLAGQASADSRNAVAGLSAKLQAAGRDRDAADLFVTIVTGARDTSPVILKAQKGLPVALTRPDDAIALISEVDTSRQWETAVPLYLGTFDEAFLVCSGAEKTGALTPWASSDSKIVDLRTRSVATLREAQIKRGDVSAVRYPEDAAIVEQNRRAWDAYRARSKKAPEQMVELVKEGTTAPVGGDQPIARYKVHLDLQTGAVQVQPGAGVKVADPTPRSGVPYRQKVQKAPAVGEKQAVAASGHPKGAANTKGDKATTYAVYGIIADWVGRSDVDGDGYYDQFSFNFGIDADASPGPATIYGKMICDTTGQAWWSASPWSVTGTATDYVYFAFTQGDFSGHLTGNTSLDFTVEMWNQAKSSRLATNSYVSGEPVHADVATSYAVYGIISDWSGQSDGDGDGYYDRFSFYVGIDADASPGPATVYGKMICETTGQAWWSASPWTVQGTPTDYQYFGFTQADFAGHLTGNADLDFTVEIWNQAKSSRLAVDTSVSNEPVRADIASAYAVYGTISNFTGQSDVDGDGYYDRFSFDMGIDADASPGPATVYGKMICETTSQAWWSATPWTVQGTATDYVYFHFTQADFSGHFTGHTNLDFTVEIWDQAKQNRLATDTSVSGEPVFGDASVEVRRGAIPGALDSPSSVPTYLNNQTMYPVPGYNGGGICWATCMVDILAYWDRNAYNGVAYWNLVDNGRAPLLQNSLPTAPGHDQANVRALVIALGTRYYVNHQPEDAAIELETNALRGLGFDATYRGVFTTLTAKQQFFPTIVAEIDAGRPIALGSWGSYFGGAHEIPVIGYIQFSDASTDQIYIHRNTGSTTSEYVNLMDPAWGNMDAVTIVPGGSPDDAYENQGGQDDNQRLHAKWLDPEDIYGFRQTHNFKAGFLGIGNDTQDWVKFNAHAGRRYAIKTERLGANCDTVLTLDDGTASMSDDDSGAEPLASQIVWDATRDTTVYIKVTDYHGSVGPNTNYDLVVTSVPHAITLAGPSGTPNPVDPGGSVSMSASASDSMGHTLAYLWSASCPTLPTHGTFNNPASPTPAWTAPANVTGNTQSCTIQVVVTDGQGQSATGTYTQNVRAGGPGPFNKTAPPNGATNQPTDGLRVSWTASSGATGYDVCYDTTNDGVCSGTWTPVGNLTTGIVSGLTAGVTYSWQVRATNASGTTYANGGTWFTFTTQGPPPPFGKISPANAATGQPSSVTVSWGASSGATSYAICYDTTNDNACGTSWTTVSATSATLSGLSPSTTYYWQVRATNAGGTTYADGVATWWSFTTRPADFNKGTPANGATGQPTSGVAVSWSASGGATSYEICYDTTNDNACGGSWTSVGNVNASTLNGLAPSTTYYWQVRASSAGGVAYANGGTWWSFWTRPADFGKTAPPNGATTPASVTLSWSASTGATSYEYCYDTSNDNSCGGRWTSAGNALTANVGGLGPGATYYWQVRAIGTGGTTYANDGAWWTFVIASQDFNKISPLNGAVDQAASGTTLSWSSVNGATNYEYCIDTTNDSACGGAWTSTGTATSATLTTLDAGTTYYWQVRVTAGGGTNYANSGTWWSFRTQLSPPSDFAKIWPANAATGQPTTGVTVSWNPSQHATSYEYCYDTTNDNACAGNWTTTTTTGATLTGLTAATTYYWQVRATNAGGTTYANGGSWWSFTTLGNDSPVPTVTQLSPTSVPPGNAAFTLTVNGTGFISTSTVRWNGNDRTTTYVSGTQLTASIPASDVAAAGQATLTVFNPPPGGGTSNGVPFRIGDVNGSATRTLPTGCYGSGALTISIAVVPSATVYSYAVEDVPPAGWTVAGINETGVWDESNKRVKWGPFVDHTTRTLSYQVTPAQGETGAKVFSGQASFDGSSVTTGGDSVLNSCAQHPADANVDFRLAIDEVTHYAAHWRSGEPWPDAPNPIPIDHVTNAGYLWRRGEVYSYVGGPAPGCWIPGTAPTGPIGITSKTTGVASSTMPGRYRPTVPITITIRVTPASGTQTWAVEDTPPASWTVGSINESGQWDAVNHRVKWGPFFDANPRTLSYVATPPGHEMGAKSFVGTASFDGESVAIGGTRTASLQAGIDLNSDGKPDIVWRNRVTGDIVFWLMNGTTVGSEVTIGGPSDRDWRMAAIADFNGDDKPDLLWRHAVTGANQIWYMNGTAYLSTATVSAVADTSWQIVAAADFNSDNKPDILWRNRNTGNNLVWYMDGAAYVDFRTIPSVPATDWMIVGADDFNGDGRTDILWRNQSTGDHVVWYMDGASYVGYGSLETVTDLAWTIVSIGDYNGDGQMDVVWRHLESGENKVTYLNGVTPIGSDVLPTVTNPDWEIFHQPDRPKAGHGDFNADGWPDILWRNGTTGENRLWYMRAARRTSEGIVDAELDLNWRSVAVADFNGDGLPDIVWRNILTGENRIWLMTGRAHTGDMSLPTITDANWRIVGAADFNRDGHPDLAWRNQSTGANVIWFLVNGVYAGWTAPPTIADTNWRIVGVGDFNGDGWPDLIWRNQVTGVNIGWFMVNGVYAGWFAPPTIADTTWEIVGVADFNGDASADLLWRNRVTGENLVWYLKNGVYIGYDPLPTLSTEWKTGPGQ